MRPISIVRGAEVAFFVGPDVILLDAGVVVEVTCSVHLFSNPWQVEDFVRPVLLSCPPAWQRLQTEKQPECINMAFYDYAGFLWLFFVNPLSLCSSLRAAASISFEGA